MEHKTQLNETNHMRKLMGLELIEEGKNDYVLANPPGKKTAGDKKATKKQRGEGFDDGDVIGVYSDIKKQRKGMSEDFEGEDFETEEVFDDEEGIDAEIEDIEEEGEEDIEGLAANAISAVNQLAAAAGADISPTVDDGEEYDEEEFEGEEGEEVEIDIEDVEQFAEQKTFKIKKDGKIINLTESQIKKIINRQKINEYLKKKGLSDKRRGLKEQWYNPMSWYRKMNDYFFDLSRQMLVQLTPQLEKDLGRSLTSSESDEILRLLKEEGHGGVIEWLVKELKNNPSRLENMGKKIHGEIDKATEREE